MGHREDAVHGRYQPRPRTPKTKRSKTMSNAITTVPASHASLLTHGFSAAAANLLHRAGVAAETVIDAVAQTGNPSATALSAIIHAVHALGGK